MGLRDAAKTGRGESRRRWDHHAVSRVFASPWLSPRHQELPVPHVPTAASVCWAAPRTLPVPLSPGDCMMDAPQLLHQAAAAVILLSC